MTNKINIIKIIGGVAILAVLIFILVNTAQNKGLDIFAQSYANFRDQEYETQIGSYVPIIDASSELNEENYFTYMAKAFDTQQSNSFRNTNAQQALTSYESKTQIYMDGFANDIGKLNSATSLLVETANTIKDESYRNIAVEITQNARQIQQKYEGLRLKYIERFSLQTDTLEALIDNEGNIYASVPLDKLKKAGVKVPILNEEIEDSIKEINEISQKMDDFYFSLKGRAGLKDYTNQFIENQ